MNESNFEHLLLIAMPSLDGTWFERAVIYLVEDNEHGTMGLTLTLPHTLTNQALFEHFKLDVDNSVPHLQQSVFKGGPVKLEHGFVLHNDTGDTWKKSMSLPDGLMMSVSEDLLQAIAKGHEPHQFITFLGFSGWDPGQLMTELKDNSWLTIPYNESLVFDIAPEKKWRVALDTLGISPEFLSMEAGNS